MRVKCSAPGECPIGERQSQSPKAIYVRVANPTSGAEPGFDVTPAELITGIITPVGNFQTEELWARQKRKQRFKGE